MGPMEQAGPADKQPLSHEITQAQLNPEQYQTANPPGRDNRANQAPEAFEGISNTVNTKERPVEAVAACTLATFSNIENRNTPITAAGLRNIASLMDTNNEVLGAHGLTKDQSAIPQAALDRFSGFLTLQAENHPSPGAKEAIHAVLNRYFKPAQA